MVSISSTAFPLPGSKYRPDSLLRHGCITGLMLSLLILASSAVPSSAQLLSLQGDGETNLEGHYIVRLRTSPAIERSGIAAEIAEFRKTRLLLHQAGATGLPLQTVGHVRRQLLSGAAFVAHRQATETAVERDRRALSTLLGRPINPTARYSVATAGFAAQLSAIEADRLRTDSRVLSVEPVVLRRVNSDVSANFLGADTLWSGAATGSASKGAGMLLAVIDSGIQRDHQSFDALAGHINPFGSGNFKGLCVATPSLCNDKLVGIWDYQGGSPTDPTDDSGHGSHVASLAVGNHLIAGGSPTSPLPIIEGIAPLASLIAYDVCTTNSCNSASILQAINQAIADGVDAINISIRGNATPWTGAESAALLDAVDMGSVVVATAGNDGSAASTVTRLEPWVLTVAASSHSRKPYSALFTPLDGVSAPAPMEVLTVGEAVGSPGSPIEVVYDGGSCAPPALLDYGGKIVLCDRIGGDPDTTVKAHDLATRNASSMVQLTWFLPYPGAIPNSRVMTTADGNALRAWAQGGAGPGGPPKAYITGSSLQLDPTYGDIIQNYSSRGPATNFDLLKPDLAAPGQLILGAEFDDVQFGSPPTDIHVQYQRGTSMAAPQVAGAALLLSDLEPTLTPIQIGSILRTTAVNSGIRKCDALDFPIPCAVLPVPADIFDYGSGRLAIEAAAKAGLALEENKTAFENADPGLGGDPATLNLPSMAKRDCPGGCAFHRTLESVASASVTWNGSFTGKGGDPTPAGLTLHVVPAVFDLSGGGQQAIAIGAYASAPAVIGVWQQAVLELAPNDGGITTAGLPVVVKPSALAPSSDLSISVTVVTPTFTGGSPVEFSIVATNEGTVPAVGAVLDAALPPGTAGASWTCTPSGNSICANGTGALSDTVALFPGDTVTYAVVVSDTAGATGDAIELTATVAPPTGLLDNAAANNTDSAALSIPIFSDGFESGDTNAWN